MGEKAGLVKRLYRYINPPLLWTQRKSTRHKKKIALAFLDLLYGLEKKHFRSTIDKRLMKFLEVGETLERYDGHFRKSRKHGQIGCSLMKDRWKKIFQLSAHLCNEDGAFMIRLVLLINLFGMNDWHFIPNYCERDMIMLKMRKQRLFKLAKDYYAYTEYLYEKRERKGVKRNVGTCAKVRRKI